VASDHPAATTSRVRECPHGVPVGPLDDYGRGPDELVTSSYCEVCNLAWTLRGHDGYVTEDDIAKAEAHDADA
jgi:hypothetical protein